MKIVQVTWVDSVHSCGWKSYQEFKEFAEDGDLKLFTVGLLAWETEYYIVVIQSAGGNNIDAMMKIPRCAILEIKDLGNLDIQIEPD